MKQLNWSLAKLLIGVAIFFNIERVDFGLRNSGNVIDIHSFVYFLGIVAVLTIVFIPQLARWPFPTLALLWLGIFLVCKLLLITQRPFLGGLYTYLSLTEGGFVLLLVYQARELADTLRDLGKMAEYVSLADVGIHLPQLDEAGSKIQREMMRSRYYHRAFSVIVVKPEHHILAQAVPHMVEEIQKTVAERRIVAKLARFLAEQLRVVDTVLEDREHNAFVILCPEVDMAGTTLLAEHIRHTINAHLGLAVSCGMASFPEEAITFESLVSEAYQKLKPAAAAQSTPSQPELLQATGD